MLSLFYGKAKCVPWGVNLAHRFLCVFTCYVISAGYVDTGAVIFWVVWIFVYG